MDKYPKVSIEFLYWLRQPKEKGYQSLLSGKKALLIYASAGDYQPGDSSDFQRPYLRRWLNFIGVSDIQEINVAPTLADADLLARTKCKAKAAARTRRRVLTRLR